MEYISANGVLSEILVDYKIRVDEIMFMSMAMDMEYKYGKFDSAKLPSQEWLDINYIELV